MLLFYFFQEQQEKALKHFADIKNMNTGMYM